MARLIGLDLARGLAVFGMYAVHVGPAPSQGGVIGFLMELAQGRSSALFAVLAGFAVVLITGRRTPKTGLAGRRAVAKVVIRAVILLAVGTALTMTGTPVVPILACYGLFFLLVLPLYRLSAAPLAHPNGKQRAAANSAHSEDQDAWSRWRVSSRLVPGRRGRPRRPGTRRRARTGAEIPSLRFESEPRQEVVDELRDRGL